MTARIGEKPRRPGESLPDYFARLEREDPTTWAQKLDHIYRLIDDPVEYIEQAFTSSSKQKSADEHTRGIVRDELVTWAIVGWLGYLALKKPKRRRRR